MSAKPRAVYIDPEQERAAIAYLRQKAGQIGFDYRQVWHGITGTKSPELELLVDLFVIANEALALDPFQQLVTFSDHVAPSLVKRGWSNPKKSTDPGTGASVLPRFAGPACLKAIYDANLRIVHAEDRWQRIQAAKGALPYLLYDHTPSAWQRPEHAAWDGLVLPVDDPWWLRHYPPRAWGCRCRVIQLGDRQLERLGKGIDQAPAETYTGYTNPRTAELQKLPIGVDPAFSFAPGTRTLDAPMTLTSAGPPSGAAPR